MRRPRLGADVDPDRLFHEASIAAERTVAIVRIVVALILGAVFILAVVTQIPVADAFLHTQIRIAALTIGGYVVLGVVSLRLASPAPPIARATNASVHCREVCGLPDMFRSPSSVDAHVARLPCRTADTT